MPAPHSSLDEPDLLQNLRRELKSGRLWLERAVVLVYAIAAGLCVVGFTLLCDRAAAQFEQLRGASQWLPLLWTPLWTAAIVWCTRRFAPGATGSGIPQVMAALEPALSEKERFSFVSLRLSAAKIILASAGVLAGLSIGREGPSVQVAAGVMQHARRWMRPQLLGLQNQALLVAGGAAGIAAAFNAPLAGVVFAIEELSRKLESRSSGLIIAAIVLSGLMAVSAFGNLSYFGVIRVPRFGWEALGPGLFAAVSSGVLGGLFAKVMAQSLTGAPAGIFGLWRRRRPVLFAAGMGLAVAVIGIASGGSTFGAGSDTVKQMLAGTADAPPLYAWLKFAATWLTAWAGVPGGIFAPALSIGAGLGRDVALLTGNDATLAPALIAMCMAGFLAAVTQAPLTSFIIVMEMVDGHAMVLSLMAAAMLASLISRLMTRPLYEVLSDHMLLNSAGAAARGHNADAKANSAAEDAPAQPAEAVKAAETAKAEEARNPAPVRILPND